MNIVENMATYHVLELYNISHYNISNYHIYTYAHFLNQKIQGYDVFIINKGINKLTHPPSKVMPRFTSLLGSPESNTKVKVASNV